MQNNQLRIIAGTHRGRKIQFPSIEGLRPTSDRLRETLFNWLQHDLAGAQCLDLFAGSGALGFEALSRGAGHVTFVEQSDVAVKQLEDNAQRLKFENASFQLTCAENFLQQTTQPFDIIFLDPPFQSNLLESCLAMIRKHQRLKDHGYIYFEMDKDADQAALSSWHIVKQKKLANVIAGLIAS